MRDKKNAPKRQRQTPVAANKKKYQGVNNTSAFQDPGTSLERKNIDVTPTAWPTATLGWTITPLNLMAQGTTANQHVGRKVSMKSLLIRSKFTCTDVTRVVVVYDKECNGALAATADIFEVDRIISPLNLSNSDRFIVLADVTPTGIGKNAMPGYAALGGNSFFFEIYRKMSLPMLFNNTTTATITAINYGAILLCTNSEQGAVADELTYSRIRYTDA